MPHDRKHQAALLAGPCLPGSMAARVRSLAALAIALSLSGCAVNVWPHRVQHTPGVSGVVLSDGMPVADAVVHIHHALRGNRCAASKLHARTDADGLFSFTGHKELKLLFVVAGDRQDLWALCIESNGEFTDGWRAMGVGYPPEQISFTCDLKSRDEQGARGRGICRPTARSVPGSAPAS